MSSTLSPLLRLRVSQGSCPTTPSFSRSIVQPDAMMARLSRPSTALRHAKSFRTARRLARRKQAKHPEDAQDTLGDSSLCLLLGDTSHRRPRAHSDVLGKRTPTRWQRLVAMTRPSSSKLFRLGRGGRKVDKVLYDKRAPVQAVPQTSQLPAPAELRAFLYAPMRLARQQSAPPRITQVSRPLERVVLPRLVKVERGPKTLPKARPQLLPRSRSASSNPLHSLRSSLIALGSRTSRGGSQFAQAGDHEDVLLPLLSPLDVGRRERYESPSLYQQEGFESGTTPPHTPRHASCVTAVTAVTHNATGTGDTCTGTQSSPSSPPRLQSGTLHHWLRSEDTDSICGPSSDARGGGDAHCSHSSLGLSLSLSLSHNYNNATLTEVGHETTTTTTTATACLDWTLSDSLLDLWRDRSFQSDDDDDDDDDTDPFQDDKVGSSGDVSISVARSAAAEAAGAANLARTSSYDSPTGLILQHYMDRAPTAALLPLISIDLAP